MSQNDMVIANANGATVRADINSALQALASANGGATAPSTTYANQLWFDTVNDQLKIRDEANANWVVAASLVGTTWIPFSNGSVLGTMANLNAAGISTSLFLSSNIALAGSLTSVTSGTPNFASSGNAVTLSSTATANTLGTVQAGFIGYIHYGVAVTVTHNATSRILPTASNINFAIGDVETVLSLGSGNWRTINVMRASGLPIAGVTVLSKTATYTVVDADFGAHIKFSGLAADATLNLPAASGRNGFYLDVSNEDATDTSPFAMIADPNSAELIDGFTTRKGYLGTRVRLACDGTGWRTVHGNWRFFSGDQTLTANTVITIAHGLGVRPQRLWGEYKCTTIDLGYAVGDIVSASGAVESDGATVRGVNHMADATNVKMITGTVTTWTQNKGTGASGNITAASWRYRVWAEA
jgi:hypothetical protein